MPAVERRAGVRTAPIGLLHIEYGLGFGGSAVSLGELVRGLADLGGFTSTILTFKPPALTRGLFPGCQVLHWRVALTYQTREAFDAAVARWPFPGIWKKGYALADWLHDLWLSFRIARLVRRRKVRVVHVNNGWEPSGIRAAAWAGARCVVHYRGFADPVSDPAAAPIAGRLGRVVTSCVGISEAVSRSIAASGVPATRIRTIHNPVDVSPFREAAARRDAIRERHGLGPTEVVAGVFGRITPWKGQRELLEALATITGECPALRLLVVGDDSDTHGHAYLDEIRRLAAGPQLAGRVIMAGYQADAPGYYAAVDMVVHCSIEPEPFGRVVIEGMAAGKPVVAMAEGGPPEIITHGADGLLVVPRDRAALAAAIERLAMDPDLRRQLGQGGLATVMARYSPTEIAAQMMEVFAEAAAGTATKGSHDS